MQNLIPAQPMGSAGGRRMADAVKRGPSQRLNIGGSPVNARSSPDLSSKSETTRVVDQKVIAGFRIEIRNPAPRTTGLRLSRVLPQRAGVRRARSSLRLSWG